MVGTGPGTRNEQKDAAKTCIFQSRKFSSLRGQNEAAGDNAGGSSKK